MPETGAEICRSHADRRDMEVRMCYLKSDTSTLALPGDAENRGRNMATQKEYLVEVRLRFEVTEVVSVSAADEEDASRMAFEQAQGEWPDATLYEAEVEVLRDNVQ